jgi:hypothetical protein
MGPLKCELYLEPKSKATQNYDVLLCLYRRRIMQMKSVLRFIWKCVCVILRGRFSGESIVSLTSMDPQTKCVRQKIKNNTKLQRLFQTWHARALCIYAVSVALYMKTCVYVMVLWLRFSGKHCIARIGLFTCVSREFVVFSVCVVLHASCPWSGKLRGIRQL